MRLRLLTGVTAAAVVVGAVWAGAPWLTLLALLGGGIAIREVYRLTPPGVAPMPTALGIIAVAALLLAAEAANGPDFHLATGLTLAAWAFAAILWFIACYNVGMEPLEGKPGEDEPENEIPGVGEPETGAGDPLVLPAGPFPHSPLHDDALESAEEENDASGEWRVDSREYADEADEGEEAGGESPALGERPWLGFLFLLLAPVYVGFLLGHGLALRDLGDDAGNLGRSWLLFALLVVFACDTAAYAVGRLAGRRRMAPRLSPNKTWEGAAGGFAASIGVAMLVGLVFELGLPLWQQAAAGAVAGVAAQLGDLAESALKRAADAKDSGSIMPGHGGILDRLDSILFALPAVFYFLLAAGFRL